MAAEMKTQVSVLEFVDPGQKKATMFAYDLWIEDTYEEVIFGILKEKQGLYNEVIDSMSAQLDLQDTTMVFAVFDRLLQKRGLKPTQRPSRTTKSSAQSVFHPCESVAKNFCPSSLPLEL